MLSIYKGHPKTDVSWFLFTFCNQKSWRVEGNGGKRGTLGLALKQFLRRNHADFLPQLSEWKLLNAVQ